MRHASFRARASHESASSTSTPAAREPLCPARRLGVGIRRPEHDPGDARRDDRVGARRRRPVVRARLERHVHRRATRTLARRSSATISPCRPAASVTPSPTISPSRTSTAPTVGFGYARSTRARASSIARASVTPAREPGAGRRPPRSSCPKIAVAATSSVAPQSWISLDVLVADAAVHLDVDRVRQRQPQPAHTVVGRLHELLARVAGMDRHAEHEVGVAAHRRHVLRLALRVEGDADLQPVCASGTDRRADVARRPRSGT